MLTTNPREDLQVEFIDDVFYLSLSSWPTPGERKERRNEGNWRDVDSGIVTLAPDPTTCRPDCRGEKEKGGIALDQI